MVALVLLLTACGDDVPTPTTPPSATTVPVTQPAKTPTSAPTATSPAPASTPAEPTSETAKQVRGMILEVTARGLTEVALLRVRDAQGREWSFTTRGPVGISPSHLREHQAFGQSVLVSYVERDGQLVALAVLD